jgi:cytochrome oxidase assembly protein ShyY1
VRFSPGWIPTAFMIFGVGLTGALGAWQLGRYQEKEAFRQEILDGLDAPVVVGRDLGGALDPLLYRKVALEGRFVAPPVLMAGRQEFQTVGYGVVQPFQVEGGPQVLVDRGWVPRDGLQRALDEIDTGGERLVLEGQLRPLGQPLTLGCQGSAAPTEPLPPVEGRPETWPPGSWPTLSRRLPEPRLDAIILAGDPILAGEGKNPDRLPVDGYHPLPRMRDSLSYAGFWWIAGIMLIIVWVGLGVSRARDPKAAGS